MKVLKEEMKNIISKKQYRIHIKINCKIIKFLLTNFILNQFDNDSLEILENKKNNTNNNITKKKSKIYLDSFINKIRPMR